jgi:uncharacterized BrkB/YihY/UPF0761 family membrane protein
MGEAFSRLGRTFAKWWVILEGQITELVDWFDEVQQRRTATAVPAAVVRKFSDDQGGRLAGQISYASFMAVFPMLIVLLTGLGWSCTAIHTYRKTS